MATLLANDMFLLFMLIFKHITLDVQRICQPPEPYESITSSRWYVALRTAATGLQSWDGWTQLHVTTTLMTSLPRQPMRRRLLHGWRLQRLLVLMALRLFMLLTSLNHQHLCRPPLLTYQVITTPGHHRHSTYNVSCNISWIRTWMYIMTMSLSSIHQLKNSLRHSIENFQ